MVPRPRLLGLCDWSADGWDYRAEHYEFVTTPPVAKSPVLHRQADLPDTWWQDLHQALAHIALVGTGRQAVREQYIRRRVPEFTGVTPARSPGPRPTATSTGPTSPALP